MGLCGAKNNACLGSVGVTDAEVHGIPASCGAKAGDVTVPWPGMSMGRS